ncbi:MAG TPA: RNA chaperone Hfq [Acidobacteria bacterium]|nr:RNA chaperone Hfq [Acidobacteriota bacterium]
MNKQGSSTINVQDPFFYQLRKEARPIHVYLLSGKRLTGILRRFDRYAIVLENRGQEQLVYKHAIASISPAGNFPEPHENHI